MLVAANVSYVLAALICYNNRYNNRYNRHVLVALICYNNRYNNRYCYIDYYIGGIVIYANTSLETLHPKSRWISLPLI